MLATGTHLMATGEVVADLSLLLPYGPPYVGELIVAKREAEHGAAPGIDGVADDVARMTAALEEAQRDSRLPEAAGSHDALHELVVRTRLRPSS